MQVKDVKTGETKELDREGTFEGIAKGTVVPVGYKPLLNADGELVLTPEANVSQNLKDYGYRQPTQADLDEKYKAIKFGEGTANELKAFGAGVGRGATFGISDFGLTQLGLAEPETLSELKERNPGATLAGEVGGAVATAFVPGSPVARLGKLGTAVAEGVRPAALAAEAGLASKIVNAAGQIGAKSLGSAVEGAAFGAGLSVSEAALGDPDLTADKIAANIGYGALIGGGIGGLVKAGELAIPAAYTRARSASQALFDKTVGRTPEGEFVSSPLSKGVSAVSKAPEEEVIQNIQKTFAGDLMTPTEFNGQAREIQKGLQEHVNAMQKLEREGFLGRTQERGALLADVAPGKANQALNYMKKQVDGVLDAMKAEPDLYPKSAVREMEIRSSLLAKARAGDDVIEKYDLIDKIRDDSYQMMRDFTKGTASYSEKKAGGLIGEVYNGAKNLLADETYWGAQGARQSQFNQAYNAFRTDKDNFLKAFSKTIQSRTGGKTTVINDRTLKTFLRQINDTRSDLQKQLMDGYLKSSREFLDEVAKTYEAAPFESLDQAGYKSLLDKTEGQVLRAKEAVEAQPGGFGAHTDWFAPMSAVAKIGRDLLANPEAMAGKLANMERAAQKTTNAISRGTRILFTPVDKQAVKAALRPIRETLSNDDKSKLFEKRVKELKKVTGDEQAFMDVLDRASKDSFAVAPNVSGALQMAAIRGTTYLLGKMPKTDPALPFDKEQKPSMAEIVSFNRAYDAVEKPLKILDELKAGIFHPESKEVLTQVYPKLYEAMKLEVLETLATKSDTLKDLPYQRRVLISDFLGEPLSYGMSPTAIASNQTVLMQGQAEVDAKEEAQMSSAGKPTASGMAKLDVADSARMPMQRVPNRA